MAHRTKNKARKQQQGRVNALWFEARVKRRRVRNKMRRYTRQQQRRHGG